MKVLRRILTALALLASPLAPALAGEPLTVFAAASLKTALDEAVQGWSGPVVLSYGGSGSIARQVSMGAPADLVILANGEWMDWLEERGALAAPARALLGNRLVVIAPAPADPLTPADLPARLGPDGRLAIGHTLSVPAGVYGRQWLEKEGLWPALSARLAETENVRAALALVARGEAPLGITYATDALAEPQVAVVYDVPQTAHDPIYYPAAVVAGAAPEAAALLDYLASEAVLQLFQRHGFLPPPEGL